MEACHPQVQVINLAVGDQFVEQGSIKSLRAKAGLDPDSIVQAVEEKIKIK